jgi:prevent-host-death family protein
MKLSEQVRSISYLKAHAPEMIRDLAEGREPIVITLHGEAKAVLQDVARYEETQETLALLKILALGNQQAAKGKVRPASEAVKRIRARLKG